MTFLEARRIVTQFGGGPELPFLFALSGTADPFQLYLQAAAAKRGFTARPRFLPVNTLSQHLAAGPPVEAAAYLLLPWDFLPEADWRSGVPGARTDAIDAVERARASVAAIRGLANAALIYLPAPVPPIAGSAREDRALRWGLESIAEDLGATRVSAAAFSLGAYFASGCPVGGEWLGRVAETAIKLITRPTSHPAKVLVTDLDNTLWAGVIAEDGTEGIGYRPEGAGYRHFVYQSLLARLRREGVLLVAVSRNDPAVVRPPLRSGMMPLDESDFVAVVASYHAKSAQIRQVALELNLGLDAFVFVDDNPVELEEVHQALPGIQTRAFPTRDEHLPEFLDALEALFGRAEVTEEDRARTTLYRRRLEGMAPVEAKGTNLARFLSELEMRLVVHDRSHGDRARAVQLINKTNQFNANGRRWTSEEIAAVLESGGRLFGATLADRAGSHGEIIACLVGPTGIIEAFVMSCRVFQRRVEQAFLAALAGQGHRPVAVRYAPTERNEPFRTFAQDQAFSAGNTDLLQFDASEFETAHRDDLRLFEVSWD